MDDIRVFCSLTHPLLSSIGTILFVDLRVTNASQEEPVDRASPVTGETQFDRLLPRITQILYANQFLFLVFISAPQLIDGVEIARKKLNEDLQCRMIGGIYCGEDVQVHKAYLAWSTQFAPRSPSLVMTDSLCKPQTLQSKTFRVASFNKGASNYELQNFPQRPVLDRPLKSTELLELALEAYRHGLPLIAVALTKPLADYWHIDVASDRGKIGVTIGHNRGLSGLFGELQRRLNIHLFKADCVLSCKCDALKR